MTDQTNNEKSTIKDWAEDDRPREKLAKIGARNLSDAELLAILIGSGTVKLSAVDVCKNILKSVDNNLGMLKNMTQIELMKFDGIGEAKAITIMAALELGRRMPKLENKITSLENSKLMYEYMRSKLSDLDHEEMWILYLDHKLRPIKFMNVSVGSENRTMFNLRIIMRTALEVKATRMILTHNHPSGDCSPSNEDKRITAQLKEAGNIMEIQLIDHIIIGDNEYYSFNDHDIL